MILRMAGLMHGFMNGIGPLRVQVINSLQPTNSPLASRSPWRVVRLVAWAIAIGGTCQAGQEAIEFL